MAASPAPRAVLTAADPEIERVRTFARVFDRYGLDALIGFVLPGIGDVLGSLLGLYIVVVAIRRRVSSLVIARMLLNLGIDMVIGVVPIIGDIADFAFHANEHNLALLESRAAGGKARASDWAVLAAVGLGFAAVLGAMIYVVIWVIHKLA
ncbi:MAG TPA: DUF4112 domain-containing protein [Kofleriaceae bacterium]|jgi:hypothetical protein|nr:DUF4112 domain-containing protein [Kofleriaceae bacterium]